MGEFQAEQGSYLVDAIAYQAAVQFLSILYVPAESPFDEDLLGEELHDEVLLPSCADYAQFESELTLHYPKLLHMVSVHLTGIKIEVGSA